MWFVLVAIWALAGCEGDGGEAARPSFVDVAAEAGVHLRTVSGTPQKEHIVECNTGGTALLDYDLDGDVDIFIVNGSRIAGYASGPRTPRRAVPQRRRLALYGCWPRGWCRARGLGHGSHGGRLQCRRVARSVLGELRPQCSIRKRGRRHVCRCGGRAGAWTLAAGARLRPLATTISTAI